MNTNLFSPDLDLRYQATLNVAEGEYHRVWPNACWGAANGWLMLLGPSPGRAGKLETPRAGGRNRPLDSHVFIGACAGRICFDANKARNARWDSLRWAAFGDMERADALTTLANLDWGNNGDHRAIPDDYLRMGCADVFEVMKEAKPRIIITLLRRTWDVLLPFLEERQSVVSGYTSGTGLECRLLRLPENDACTLLLRSPQHPSRHFFNCSHVTRIGLEVEHFLRLSGCPRH